MHCLFEGYEHPPNFLILHRYTSVSYVSATASTGFASRTTWSGSFSTLSPIFFFPLKFITSTQHFFIHLSAYLFLQERTVYHFSVNSKGFLHNVAHNVIIHQRCLGCERSCNVFHVPPITCSPYVTVVISVKRASVKKMSR